MYEAGLRLERLLDTFREVQRDNEEEAVFLAQVICREYTGVPYRIERVAFLGRLGDAS